MVDESDEQLEITRILDCKGMGLGLSGLFCTFALWFSLLVG